ncbi:MAG TPA: transglycosylase SLT domain-containing protein [Pyrinomonadaceae bacterium]|nr:transglycosylase SLT domain-containing protein [Pyrinomonadaceae bacterium]
MPLPTNAAAFIEDIQQAVNQYARRIAPPGDKSSSPRDLRLVFERGAVQAPTLMSAFKARNISPLIGLYLPWVESEYENIQSPNPMGAIGMFQFLPGTGERFGLTTQDLLDVEKSADAAARYISDGLEQFRDDPMKEALALLAYNRGGQQTARDLKFLANDQNRQCSICALTADRSKLDERFRYENVYYVPRFFAAAIIGENPRAFGLQNRSLSASQP